MIIRLAAGTALFTGALFLGRTDPIQPLLYLVSYLIMGGPVLWEAARSMFHGKIFNEYFLISTATIGAFAIGEYPEGAAVMLFYLIGETLQQMAVGRSERSIRALLDIKPDYANLLEDGVIRRVSPQEVPIGAHIIVKSGERIPIDGVVKDGVALADTAALTGESTPRELNPGSEALSGFINQNGVITIETTKEFSRSTVSRILDLVANAGSKKAPLEHFLTKFAKYYTPGVVFGAIALAVIPPLVIPGAAFSDWIYRALVFLVVSCPCALVISIPLGFIGGIGGASKRGILVKGSNYLEGLNRVDTVIFDKTGTLTKGISEVTVIYTKGQYTEGEILEFAAYAEYHSGHPIARSIRRAYAGTPDIRRIQQYEEISGMGLKVVLDGRTILAGSTSFMLQENIPVEERDLATLWIHIAVDREYEGSIGMSDAVKEDSAQAIRELRALGVRRAVMFTGDTTAIGESIAKELGLDEVCAQLLPDEKVYKLELYQSCEVRRGSIIFVGDGINDAPALASAEIGVAMGGLGSDAAIEAADIVLMTDEPSKIGTAIRIARRTRRIVFQNIVLALGVKVFILALGAAGIASMWGAVFADVGVALLAIFNAMRAMNTKKLK